jgi:hypothetical protein
MWAGFIFCRVYIMTCFALFKNFLAFYGVTSLGDTTAQNTKPEHQDARKLTQFLHFVQRPLVKKTAVDVKAGRVNAKTKPHTIQIQDSTRQNKVQFADATKCHGGKKKPQALWCAVLLCALRGLHCLV